MEEAEEVRFTDGDGIVHMVLCTEYDQHGMPCGQYPDWCEFDKGYAYCPPPAFDLQDYIDRVGPPPILTNWLPFGYDIETDQITEDLP
jgi:hypothetical protein